MQRDVNDSGLTDAEERYKGLIDAEVQARAAAVREERERSRNIAALCVDARRAGVRMSTLARFVRVLDRDDELRPISRQAVDQLIVGHTGRERRPRVRAQPAPENGRPDGGVRLEAFG